MIAFLRESVGAKDANLRAHPSLQFLLTRLRVLLSLIVALWREHINEGGTIRITRLEWPFLENKDDGYKQQTDTYVLA